jgi:hypothetical protein
MKFLLAIAAISAVFLPSALGKTSEGNSQSSQIENIQIVTDNCSKVYTLDQFKNYARQVYQRWHISKKAKKRMKRIINCQRTDVKEKQARKERKKFKRQWKKRFYWQIQYNDLSPGDKSWAASTSGCETSNGELHDNATGNTYHGRFQFLLSTWAAAGGTGDPHTKSYEEQAVIAVRFMHRDGSGHWPVCG